MAPHSSTLAWKIPWMEEPGGLQAMGSRRVEHDWATSLSLFTFMHWRRKWQPTPVFLPGESQGPGSLMGCRLWGRTEWTWLKWLSSSSSSMDFPILDTSYEWNHILCSFLFLISSLWGLPLCLRQVIWKCNVGNISLIPRSEDPLEKGMATHSSILSWRIPWTEEPGRPWGRKESDTTEWLTSFSFP